MPSSNSTVAPRYLRAILVATAVAAGVASLSGCSLEQMTIKQTVDVMAEGSVAMDREKDPVFAREALPASLKTFETLLVNDPDNERLLELLAEGYFSYAFGFVEYDLAEAQVEVAPEERIERLQERAVLHYLRARDYGFRLLDRPKLEEAAMQPDLEVVQSQLKKVGREDVPGLFWAAYGWGSAINLSQQDPDLVAGLPVVEAMMERVAELDPTYYDSGVHTFFGVYYASRPKMAGGSPEKAKKHFEKAMEQHGDRNLMIPFLYGRYYGAQTQNRELFDRMMKKVAEADLSKHPDRRLNNEIARKRASLWSEHADELFY